MEEAGGGRMSWMRSIWDLIMKKSFIEFVFFFVVVFHRLKKNRKHREMNCACTKIWRWSLREYGIKTKTWELNCMQNSGNISFYYDPFVWASKYTSLYLSAFPMKKNRFNNSHTQYIPHACPRIRFLKEDSQLHSRYASLLQQENTEGMQEKYERKYRKIVNCTGKVCYHYRPDH